MISLADLDAMGRAGLAALWSDLFGTSVPPKMSQPMQRRFLAFELQVRDRGGLPPVLLARLARFAEGKARTPTPGLEPGARLLREWCGTTHVVDVRPDGYLWNGTRYRSLSAIARAITGARWSGPRFFGLIAAAGTGPVADQGKTGGGRRARADRGTAPAPRAPKRERVA